MKYSPRQIRQIKYNLERYCEIGTRFGIFRVNQSESLKHNLIMAEQFVKLSYEGFAVSVRPKLKNGNIPDLLILNLPIPQVKEIIVTETEERFKSKDYMGLNKIKVMDSLIAQSINVEVLKETRDKIGRN